MYLNTSGLLVFSWFPGRGQSMLEMAKCTVYVYSKTIVKALVFADIMQVFIKYFSIDLTHILPK